MSQEIDLINDLKLSMNKQIACLIFFALEVCNDKEFAEWAEKWLNNEDRSMLSAKSIFRHCRYEDTGHHSKVWDCACMAAQVARDVAQKKGTFSNGLLSNTLQKQIDKAFKIKPNIDLTKIIKQLISLPDES